MTPRCVLFDVYRTLLEVGPPPPDAETHWQRAWNTRVGTPTPLTLAALTQTLEPLVRTHHAQARALGIPHPEVHWPGVMTEALPDLASLDPSTRADLLVDHARLTRTVRLAPGAIPVLHALQDRHIPMGIASNAQAYTRIELADALAPAGFGLNLFEPALTFWSFEHGFSKPDPHVFRILTARLLGRGIPPAATIMVGDRLDNDIDPARRAGWQAWHVDPADPAPDWIRLHAHLASSPTPAHPGRAPHA